MIFRFTSWAPNQPDGEGDCVAVQDGILSPQWHDVQCANYTDVPLLASFVCESEPVGMYSVITLLMYSVITILMYIVITLLMYSVITLLMYSVITILMYSVITILMYKVITILMYSVITIR